MHFDVIHKLPSTRVYTAVNHIVVVVVHVGAIL